MAYLDSVLPFGLSLVHRTFTKCMDVALSPLMNGNPPLAPLWEKKTLVVRADSAASSSSLAHAPETRSHLSSEQDNMAPSARALGSSPLAARRQPTSLPEKVLNTISEARAPSTRCLYARKLSVFSTWCLDCSANSTSVS